MRSLPAVPGKESPARVDSLRMASASIRSMCCSPLLTWLASPEVGHEVYVPHQHAVAGDVFVPAFLLAVFEDEEVVFVFSADDSGHVVGQRVERDALGAGDDFRF